jgi:hypothetical protein
MTDETTETPPTPDPGAGARAWARPVALVVACLVIGFVVGWVIRGDDGSVTVLPTGSAAVAAQTSQDATTTAPHGRTVTADAPPAPPPDRSDIALAVLNGTGTAGLAAQTAGQAQSLGYPTVATGNAPAESGTTVAYFRRDQRPAARRVADDLQIGRVRPLPRKGGVADAAPSAAEVIVVLGAGSG